MDFNRCCEGWRGAKEARSARNISFKASFCMHQQSSIPSFNSVDETCALKWRQWLLLVVFTPRTGASKRDLPRSFPSIYRIPDKHTVYVSSSRSFFPTPDGLTDWRTDWLTDWKRRQGIVQNCIRSRRGTARITPVLFCSILFRTVLGTGGELRG